MAAVNPNQVRVLYKDGEADRIVLYALKNVTAADTVDFSQEFSFLKRAVMLGATINGATSASVSSPATVTIPATVANDAIYVLAWGCAA